MDWFHRPGSYGVVLALACLLSVGGVGACSDDAPTRDSGSVSDAGADTGNADTGQAQDSSSSDDGSADVGSDAGQTTPRLVIDHTCTDLSRIPEAALARAKADLHIAYQHTSHGSQLITGMNALAAYPAFGSKYAWAKDGGMNTLDLADRGIPGCDDLSQGDSVDQYGDTPWVKATRTLLDNPDNSDINVVLWSWCSINGHDAQRYVDNMEKLISEYPEVTFPLMTGHAEGDSEDLTEDGVHYNNELIRKHCRDHKRLLFDFADVEAYDPDGTYFWDKAMRDNLDYTGSNWAVQWCAANKGSDLERLTSGDGVSGYDGCSGCAHSSSPVQANLNCVLKGRAAWWMWAAIAGWSGS